MRTFSEVSGCEASTGVPFLIALKTEKSRAKSNGTPAHWLENG